MERRRYIDQNQSQKDDESIEGPTTNLALVNGIFYVITALLSRNLLFTQPLPLVLFGFSWHNFTSGLIWTPITSIFTHSGIFHIGGNMIFLFVYGFKLEEMGYNDRGVYEAYFVTGLLATFLSAPFFYPNVIFVGASGAIFGLLGVFVGTERREGTSNYKSALFAAIILFVMTSSSPNTNILAHLAGLIVGIILGNSNYFAQYQTEPREDQSRSHKGTAQYIQ